MLRAKYYVPLVVILVEFMTVLPTAALSCTKIDECSCKFDDGDGSVVTLRPLLTEGHMGPLFQDQLGKDGYYYSYNPCLPFNEGNCTNSALCQLQTVNGSAKSLVDQQNVQFGYDGKSVIIIYLSSDPLPIQAVVTLLCLENQSPPLFNVYGYQSDTREYQFELLSECACKGGCRLPNPPNQESSTIGAGSIVIIVFFVIAALYLVLGTIHGRVVRKAHGLEMLPNYQFWVAVPGFVKEGCLALVECRSCRPARTTYDEV